jgi:hypothetical protein
VFLFLLCMPYRGRAPLNADYGVWSLVQHVLQLLPSTLPACSAAFRDAVCSRTRQGLHSSVLSLQCPEGWFCSAVGQQPAAMLLQCFIRVGNWHSTGNVMWRYAQLRIFVVCVALPAC